MSIDSRLGTAQRLLIAGVLLRALGWGIALGGGLLLLAGIVDIITDLSTTFRHVALVMTGAIGAGTTLLVIWRSRAVRLRDEVALWLENRVPTMNYALVTLVGGRFPDVSAPLERVVAESSWREPLGRALRRGAGVPLLVAAGVLAGLFALPSSTLVRLRSPRPGDVLDRPAKMTLGANPFKPLLVIITSPAYADLPEQTLEDPETVPGLTGSRVRVEGSGDGRGITAGLGNAVVRLSSGDGRWAAAITMPDTAAALSLVCGDNRRLLVLEPRIDSVPVVRLLRPMRDTVRKSAAGTIELAGDARDDFGLDQGWFEYIISSGEGENFTFRSGVVGRRALNRARSGTWETGLSLDSLKLAPGNILHLRLVARDGNTTTGPGLGYSDTRTIRIPRPGEGDSVAVDAAAPTEGDSSLLSERTLILLAESLERRRARLRRDTVVAESHAMARDQASLRRRVADIIFLRLGTEASGEETQDSAGQAVLTPEALLAAAEQATVPNGGQPLDFNQDESPVVMLNRPLLEAYNAMWDAGRELEIGEPGRGLPHMRVALAAIQRARQAERIYLRGRPTAVVVDLARVRLAGKLVDASPGEARGRPADHKAVDALATRFSRAVQRLPDSAVLDSLTLLRVDALVTAPGFAGALGQALAALRSGKDATDALIRARRALAPAIVAVPQLTAWAPPP